MPASGQYAASFYKEKIQEYKSFANKMRRGPLGDDFDIKLFDSEGPQARMVLIWTVTFNAIEKANAIDPEHPDTKKLWESVGVTRPRGRVDL